MLFEIIDDGVNKCTVISPAALADHRQDAFTDTFGGLIAIPEFDVDCIILRCILPEGEGFPNPRLAVDQRNVTIRLCIVGCKVDLVVELIAFAEGIQEIFFIFRAAVGNGVRRHHAAEEARRFLL